MTGFVPYHPELWEEFHAAFDHTDGDHSLKKLDEVANKLLAMSKSEVLLFAAEILLADEPTEVNKIFRSGALQGAMKRLESGAKYQ